MKIIIGTSGQINERLRGVPNGEFLGITNVNGQAWIVLKSDVTPIAAGEVQIVEKILEVEVIKEIEIDNPKTLEMLKTSQTNEQKLIGTIGELDKQIKNLKAQNTKLKKALAED